MKNVSWVRDHLMTGVIQMLEKLRIQVGMYHPEEQEVLAVLERPRQFDEAVEVTNFVMDRLGHSGERGRPAERFDKTRRALNRKYKTRGRGVLTPEDQAILTGAKEP